MGIIFLRLFFLLCWISSGKSQPLETGKICKDFQTFQKNTCSPDTPLSDCQQQFASTYGTQGNLTPPDVVNLLQNCEEKVVSEKGGGRFSGAFEKIKEAVTDYAPVVAAVGGAAMGTQPGMLDDSSQNFYQTPYQNPYPNPYSNPYQTPSPPLSPPADASTRTPETPSSQPQNATGPSGASSGEQKEPQSTATHDKGKSMSQAAPLPENQKKVDASPPSHLPNPSSSLPQEKGQKFRGVVRAAQQQSKSQHSLERSGHLEEQKRNSQHTSVRDRWKSTSQSALLQKNQNKTDTSLAPRPSAEKRQTPENNKKNSPVRKNFKGAATQAITAKRFQPKNSFKSTKK